MVEPGVIERIPRFAGLSSQAKDWLSRRFTRKTFAKSDSIFYEGDPCLNLQLIEKGSVKIFKTLESGRELIMNIFREGEAIGEVALIDGVEYPASAFAHEDTFLLELPRQDYFSMSKLFPEIPFAIIRDLNYRVRSMNRRMQELGSGSAEVRLAHVLLALTRTGKAEGVGVRIPFHLSRQELADMVGIRIETVIRIMSKWHKTEIVVTLPDGFLIPRLDRIEEVIRAGSS